MIRICLLAGIFFWCVDVKSVDLYCWVVSDSEGGESAATVDVANLISDVNKIYQQVTLSFEIKSLVYTNDADLAIINRRDRQQRRRLCDIAHNTGGVEIYFVQRIDGNVNGMSPSGGVIVTQNISARSLAHELGHACGLSDIYVRHKDFGDTVDGLPSRERMPNDWGWYPPYVSQADVIRRMLMYGYESPMKIDITYGDVYGLWYYQLKDPQTRRWTKIWNVSLAPVGFGIHGNRHPVSE